MRSAERGQVGGSSASLMRRGQRAEAADGSDVDWRDVTNL